MTTDAVDVRILKLDAIGSIGVTIEGNATEIKVAGVTQLEANVWSAEELHAPLGCAMMRHDSGLFLKILLVEASTKVADGADVNEARVTNVEMNLLVVAVVSDETSCSGAPDEHKERAAAETNDETEIAKTDIVAEILAITDDGEWVNAITTAKTGTAEAEEVGEEDATGEL